MVNLLQREYSPTWLFFPTTIYILYMSHSLPDQSSQSKSGKKASHGLQAFAWQSVYPTPRHLHTCHGSVVDISVRTLPDSFKSRFPHVIAYSYLQKVPDQVTPWRSWLWHVLSARVHALQSVAILATGLCPRWLNVLLLFAVSLKVCYCCHCGRKERKSDLDSQKGLECLSARSRLCLQPYPSVFHQPFHRRRQTTFSRAPRDTPKGAGPSGTTSSEIS